MTSSLRDCPNCLSDKVEEVDHKGRYLFCDGCGNIWEVVASAKSEKRGKRKQEKIKLEPMNDPSPSPLLPYDGLDFP